MAGISDVRVSQVLRHQSGYGVRSSARVQPGKVVPGTAAPARPVGAWIESTSAWRSLQQDAASSVRTVEVGETVYGEGGPADRCYLVRSGRCELRVSRGDGWSQVTGEVEAGELMGHAALLAGQVYETAAVARERTVVWSVPGMVMRNVALIEPEVALKLFEDAHRRARTMLETSAELALLTLEQRLIRFLLRRAGGASWSYSHEDLAMRLGGCREEITRLLSKLKRKGLIRIGRRRVELVDELGLRRMQVALGFD